LDCPRYGWRRDAKLSINLGAERAASPAERGGPERACPGVSPRPCTAHHAEHGNGNFQGSGSFDIESSPSVSVASEPRRLQPRQTAAGSPILYQGEQNCFRRRGLTQAPDVYFRRDGSGRYPAADTRDAPLLGFVEAKEVTTHIHHLYPHERNIISTPTVEHITVGATLFAIILRHSHEPESIEFMSPDDAELQLGVMRRPAGYVIEPHVHTPVERLIRSTAEALFVTHGRLELSFFDERQELARQSELGPGDCVLLLSGGHGLRMLEDCRIVEIKQGPYAGPVNDKIRFGGAGPTR
jgi:hypothetical protein